MVPRRYALKGITKKMFLFFAVASHLDFKCLRAVVFLLLFSDCGQSTQMNDFEFKRIQNVIVNTQQDHG